ncbi:hypothetical protein EMN47_05010 [Prolixibacteraceae bacterium JC049]|nr:hypothetical protein [Prolixibacteraceae bacterium JC049]
MLNKKITIFVGLLLLTVNIFAQKVNNNNTTSPYSRFGIGELQPTSFGRTSAMGGAAIASRSKNQLNLTNPASYTAIDTMSFIFEAGLTSKQSSFKDANFSQNNNNTNFQYFAFNFPITSWSAVTFGLRPYSDAGYDIIQTEKVSEGTAAANYFGEGSLSKVFLGQAFDITPNLSVGANMSYIFGSLTKNTTLGFPSVGAYSYQKYDSLRVRKIRFDFGVQYTHKFNKNHELTIGATYESESDFNTEVKNAIYRTTSIVINNNQTQTLRDTIAARTKADYDITMPSAFGIGFSYNYKKKLIVNLDYYRQNWSNAKIDFGPQRDYDNELTDLNQIAIGAEWTPNKYALKGYYNRVSYRAGFNYTNGYLKVNNKTLSKYGMTFGLGLPLSNSLKRMQSSMVNIGVELGRMGSIKDGLVRENYVKLNVSFSLYDNWFIKRQFD